MSQMQSNRWVKVFAPLLALAVIALAVAGCGSSDDSSTSGSSGGGDSGSGEPVQIAAPADLTGTGAGLGIPWKQAINAAVAYTNDTGGLNGSPVTVDYKDTQSDQTTAAQVTNEMLSSGKYEILLLAAGGSETLPILEASKRYPDVIVLGSGTVPSFGDGNAYPMGFQTDDSPEASGEASACQMHLKDAKKVGIIGLNDEYTTQSDASVAEKLESLGIEVTGHEEISLTSTNVTPQLQKLQQSGADTLFVDAYYTPLASVLSGLKALDWEPQIIASRQATAIPLEYFTEESDYPKAMEGLGFAAQVRQPKGLSKDQKTAIKYIEEQIHGEYAGSLSLYAFAWDGMMLARWGANEGETTSGKEITEKLETLSEEPDADTGALIQANPPLTDEVHEVKDATHFGVDMLAPLKEGLQPSETEVPPTC
jgi:ABC-type branched-subunit amino acid transport system substrate-binding protein